MRNRATVVWCAWALAAGCAIDACAQPRDAELLIGAFSEIHPGHDRFASEAELEAAAGELRAVAAGEPGEGAFYLAVQRYLATIRCEHTEAELPEALQERLAASMLPVDFEYVPDANGSMRAIVVGVAEGVKGVREGDELLSVNGTGVHEIYAAAAPLISVDGATDHTKTSLFAGSDDIGLTTFDVLHPLLFGDSRSYVLEVVSAGGEPRTVIAGGVDESVSLAMRGVAAQKNFSDDGAVQWEMIDDRTARLWVSTFVNYRTPVDADEVFGSVFAAINASGADRLVMDLRDVGGGSGDVQRSLMRHLIDAPIAVGGPTRVRAYRFDAFREHLRTWDESVFSIPESMFTPDGGGMYVVNPMVGGKRETIEPAADAWRGELVLLCGPTNESGATMMLAELREQRAMTLVGEPTGGNAEGCTAGIIAFLTLPDSGIVARLPLLRSRTSAEDFEPGMGVSPDVLAPMTAEALRAGEDPAMAAALER